MMIVTVALFCVALSLVSPSNGAAVLPITSASMRVARQAPPPLPEGLPAPPFLERVARQAPPPPPEGAPPPPSIDRVARQAPPPPPEGAPAPPSLLRIARQLPPPPELPQFPGQMNAFDMSSIVAAADSLYNIRARREAKGTVRLPTKTG